MREPKILKRTEFGNPILQTPSKKLTKKEISSEEIHQLIADMRHTVSVKKYGVGIAAPQVGRPVALSVISIKKTPARPEAHEFNEVIINPSFEGLGKQEEMWEGCISFSAMQSPVFAKAVRYKRIRAKWIDEKGIYHEEDLDGLIAHVFQHETDHLNGILFPERVKDHRSWMNANEYKKMMVSKTKDKKKTD
jgi:peptide deformylase